MTNKNNNMESNIDLLGKNIARRLLESTDYLSSDVLSRLKFSREMAALRACNMSPEVIQVRGGVGLIGWGRNDAMSGVYAMALALVLAFGLILIDNLMDERLLVEIARIDTEILTGDLPPLAYLDGGFIEFIKQASSQP